MYSARDGLTAEHFEQAVLSVSHFHAACRFGDCQPFLIRGWLQTSADWHNDLPAVCAASMSQNEWKRAFALLTQQPMAICARDLG